MILREELIEIGIYNKSHGIAGEISASFLCELGYVASFSCLVTEIEGIFVPFFVESSRGKGSNSLLLKLEGINDEVGAKQMTNKPIYVKKSEYEALQAEQDCDEMPIDFFIGYSAQDSELGIIGEVTDVDDSTENVLFVITTSEGKNVYVPAVDEFIAEIDQDNKTLKLQLPEGLLEI